MRYNVLGVLGWLLRASAYLLYAGAALALVVSFGSGARFVFVLAGAVGAVVLAVGIHANAEALDLILNTADHVNHIAYRLDKISLAAERTADATSKLAATIPTPKR